MNSQLVRRRIIQYNKNIQKTNLLKKEENKDRLNTDSIPILSYPFPWPLSFEWAPLPEKKGAEQKDAYKIYEKIIKDNIEYEHLINVKRHWPHKNRSYLSVISYKSLIKAIVCKDVFLIVFLAVDFWVIAM